MRSLLQRNECEAFKFSRYDLALWRLETQVRLLWRNVTTALFPALVAKMKPDVDAVADRDEVLIGTPEALGLALGFSQVDAECVR